MMKSVLSNTVFTVFILVCSALFFQLSAWQFHRLEGKQDLLQRLDALERQDPWQSELDLAQAGDFSAGTITGRYIDGVTLKLAPRMWMDQLGAHALSPFQTQCCVIWVNRGWVPGHWEAPSLEESSQQQLVTLAGALQSPDINHMFQADNYPSQGIWYWTDLTDMNMAIGRDDADVTPYIFHLKDQQPGRETVFPEPVPVESVRPNNNHLAYAIFWLVMGLMILGLGGYRLTRNFVETSEVKNP